MHLELLTINKEYYITGELSSESYKIGSLCYSYSYYPDGQVGSLVIYNDDDLIYRASFLKDSMCGLIDKVHSLNILFLESS